MYHHTELIEDFEHVREGNASMGKCYVFSDPDTGSDFFEVYVYGEKMNEYRFVIDNFPAQRKFYTTNLPYESIDDFLSDMKRIGIDLIRKK